ncbi:unnamed protein product [Closterium sp. NIES-54]
MAITIYFIATSLPDRLALVRDAFLLKPHSELTYEVLELALKDVESNLRSVASTSGAVPPPLFHGCTVPQLPTFTASLATAATNVTAAAVTNSSRSRGRSGTRGGQGAGGGGGGGDVASGGSGSAGAGGAPRAAAGDSPAAAGGGDARVSAATAAPPLAAATAAAVAVAGFGAGVSTASAAVRCRPPSLHLSRSDRCPPRPAFASDFVYLSVVSLGASLDEVAVASVGTCVDTSPGAAPEDASLSFTLDSGASHCFFRDRTTLTLLPRPVSVALADPTSGPVTARYTIPLPCPAVPSGSPTGFHVPSFSRIEAARESARGCVPVSGPVAVSCSSRSLAHPTVLWPHRMGHSTISCLRAMSSKRLVLGLPRVLPLLPALLAPPCEPCIEGRLCATPHSSSLRQATEPFETLHLDVWGPASRSGPERESFFLVVVDDYSRYTTVFPLAKKSDVTSMLIRWLLTTADTRGRRVSCLHSDLRGLVMEIARTSMTHASAPYFLWPYAVWYAAHQLNLWPCVSRPEVSPTSLWTGSLGAVSRFRVLGCLALVRDTSADKISPRAVPCVFIGFPEGSSDYTFTTLPFTGSLTLVTSVSTSPSPTTLPPLIPPRQPTADPAGAGFRGEDPRGASSRGAGVGAKSVPVRGPGSGGAGFGAEPVTAGDSSLQGAGVSGAVPGGATTGGVPSAGHGEPGTDPVTSGGASSGGGATGSLERGPGATTAPDTTPPPHPYPTRHQARVRRAREEQLELEREERELEWQRLELQWQECQNTERE